MVKVALKKDACLAQAAKNRDMSSRAKVLIFLSLSLAPQSFAQVPSPGVSNALSRVDVEEIENKVADAFAEGDCNKVRALADPQVILQARAPVLAVFAHCEVLHNDPEALFQRAEAMDPSSDTKALLHARYRWKRDPISSIPLWNRVLILARNPTIQSMARDFIMGVGSQEEQALDLDRGEAYYAQAQLGTGYETNPAQANTHVTGSSASIIQSDLSYQKTYGFGYLGVNASTFNSFFSSAREFNFSLHQIAVPFGLFASNDADVIVQPFTNYSTEGGSPFQILYGIAVTGIAYRATYRQSVKGSIFIDHYYDATFNPQQGTHFRFEYNWEFFVPSWFYRFGWSVEHVKANQDYTDDENNLTGKNALISYSHTDFGLGGLIERSFRNLSLAVAPEIIVREDSDQSTFALAGTGESISRRREDLLATVRATLTYTRSTQLQMLLWYEWSQSLSNFGPRDFEDFNYQNQTLMFALQGKMRSF